MFNPKVYIILFINLENGNQYIGSAKDFYLRLNEHLVNKKSNVALQSAFTKYGLDKLKSPTPLRRASGNSNINLILHEIYIMKSILVSGLITEHLPFLWNLKSGAFIFFMCILTSVLFIDCSWLFF